MNVLNLLNPELRRQLRKQRIAEKRPTCLYCGRRQEVFGVVARGGALVKPTYTNRLFPWRKFVAHLGADEKTCKGSGQPLCIARGFDR